MAKSLILIVIAFVLGIGFSKFYFVSNPSGEPKPLYWVAPMDPNYKRDQPGKSPMGMDLIPVFEEINQEDPEVVKISPAVVQNLGVKTVQIKERRLEQALHAFGSVMFSEEHLLHFHPRVEGWVEKLTIKAAGDPVKKGQAMYALYSPELVNAQEEYVLAINRGDSNLISGTEDRLRSLQIPSSTIKKLRKDKKVQQAVTFYSPLDGVVDNLNIREGFFVQPGTMIMSLASLDEVWVEVDIFESHTAQIKVGQKAEFTLDYNPQKTWLGEVDYIYPRLNESSRTLRLRLSFQNKNGLLKPNMYGQVHIQINDNFNVLALPREALIRTENSHRVVQALGEGRFKSVEVSIGRSDQNYFEVISGLEEGDSIVTSAQFLIDSESNKNAEFLRMDDSSSNDTAVRDVEQNDLTETVWAYAELGEINEETEMITLTHEPIPEWSWPEMTMMFTHSLDRDALNEFKKHKKAEVQIRKKEDGYELIQIRFLNKDKGADKE